MRPVLAVLAGAAVAALGAAILGEYQFDSITGAAAGLIFGLFVSEAAVAVARRGSAPLAVACAAMTAGGLGWAIHASIGARASIPSDVPGMAWLAVALGVVGAAFRARSSGRREAGTRAEPARTPGSVPDETPSPERPAG